MFLFNYFPLINIYSLLITQMSNKVNLIHRFKCVTGHQLHQNANLKLSYPEIKWLKIKFYLISIIMTLHHLYFAQTIPFFKLKIFYTFAC